MLIEVTKILPKAYFLYNHSRYLYFIYASNLLSSVSVHPWLIQVIVRRPITLSLTIIMSLKHKQVPMPFNLGARKDKTCHECFHRIQTIMNYMNVSYDYIFTWKIYHISYKFIVHYIPSSTWVLTSIRIVDGGRDIWYNFLLVWFLHKTFDFFYLSMSLCRCWIM